ncbi:MAG: aminopeptidase N, partial [Pseudomonadota bacterium]
LDVFNIVAVDDFNMGAMENKGLNIFNSKFVLASPETATDRDYELIESIIAHEYFHNWTGNRITCRDWFQLCLKEGLTVFRDQQFSADERSEAVQRIGDVKALRARQFREDAGPLAHPVRPEEYIEINNFYTSTVYEKGAEVIRMLHTLVGPEAYRKGTDLYFERHDGQACTIEDWIKVFEDATGRDLGAFARWYSQAGTPEVTVAEDWEPSDGTLTLTVSQKTAPTPGQPEKGPQVIPVAIGLIAPDGSEAMETKVVELNETQQDFRFAGLEDRPVASLLRGFSAPIVLNRDLDDGTRAFLLAHDTDPFNRWEAGRTLAMDIALRLVSGGAIPDLWTEAMGKLLRDPALDPAFKALALDVPGADEVSAEIHRRGDLVNPDSVYRALSLMRSALGEALAGPLRETYHAMAVPGPYTPDAKSAGKRALANRCLALLATGDNNDEGIALAQAQFETADNMSMALPALRCIVEERAADADAALDAFHEQWKDDVQVVDKWLALQASVEAPGALDRVIKLTDHPSFDWKNPNKFRSLIGVFAMMNPTGFHAADGAGYRFLTDWLLRLDALNPQTTARLAGVFETWTRYTKDRQTLMKSEMERMAATDDLSKNTREIVERMLGT